MKKYIEAQNKTNVVVLDGNVKQDEVDRFAASDLRWAENRKKAFQHRKIKKGEIYQFEFGKNFVPEMSYEHRGMVIGVKKKMLYVLPIFSHDSSRYPDVYHPLDSPDSKSDLYLLKNSEFDFINHDSVLKLNDIRSVSINRILYQHKGSISHASDIYRSIETLVFKKYFSNFYYELENKNNEMQELNSNIEKLEEENIKLKKELEELKIKL